MTVHRRISMPADHPVFAGHFPDHPVVPGAWLLDRVVETLAEAGEAGPWRVATAKFLSPAGPDEHLDLTVSPPAAGGLRAFRIDCGGRTIASGRIGPLEA
ncbi:MAG: hypothetical protein KDH20_13210 [Rhodocyclaceae bacterium]|nr:hypothetical protein [Rhodocyclaceae bacterium]